MSPRSVALLVPFLLTVILGAWILFAPNQRNVPGELKRASMRESVGSRKLAAAPPQDSQDILSKVTYVATLFRTNKELFVYASIAVFGILITALAFAGVKTTPKTDTILESLKQEKEKAEHLAKLKSEFLNQVSHELRTPLAVIIGYIECITDGLYGEIESKHQEILQIVAKQSSHLKNMIDQILIFSRLEANKQPLRVEEFSVSKIFGDLRDTFDFLCTQKGLELRWELSSDVDTLKTDPERFKEVVSNLLQNAVKYTDRGNISVRLNWSTTDVATLEVSDTGIGIAQHHLTSIFDPFMQAHKTSSENSRGGIGLGLSIVKKHIEQMKGVITVESELGKGTTFRVRLPRAYEEKRRLATQRLRNLIRLPAREKGGAVSQGVSSSDKLGDLRKAKEAV
jgi:signal transduction histidine kinase